MNYLALGDSISIDEYTEVGSGGAASQFARLVGAAQFQDLTRDGRTTAGVLEAWSEITLTPDVVTLTAGGNDFLQGAFQAMNSLADWRRVSGEPLANLEAIAARLAGWACPVILNTVYDPTDGDDSRIASFGMAAQARTAFNALNDGIRDLAHRQGFLLADLEILFHGHGPASADPWIVMQIEPNLAGATAIARHWHDLYSRR
jgi:acyl-CoA thioesterase-1